MSPYEYYTVTKNNNIYLIFLFQVIFEVHTRQYRVKYDFRYEKKWKKSTEIQCLNNKQ